MAQALESKKGADPVDLVEFPGQGPTRLIVREAGGADLADSASAGHRDAFSLRHGAAADLKEFRIADKAVHWVR